MTSRTRGMGGVYQRGDIWWVRYSLRGKRYRESSGSTSRAEAVKLLRKRFGEIGNGKTPIPHSGRVTLGDLLSMLETDYRINGRHSLDRARQACIHLNAFFGADCKAEHLTTDKIAKYVEDRLEAGAARATVNYEQAILRRGFRLAAKAGRITIRPEFSMLHVENARRGFLEADQIRALLARLPEYLRPPIEFAYISGWRTQSEILTREWRHIDLEEGWARLDPGETKNGRGRDFPLFGGLLETLKTQRTYVRQIERRTGHIIPWVFIYPSGEPIRSYRHAWAKACNEAGLPGRLVHDLRRSAARALIRSGVSQTVAMQITGHETDTIFRRYAISDAGMLREAAEKLAAFHSGKGTIRVQLKADKQ